MINAIGHELLSGFEILWLGQYFEEDGTFPGLSREGTLHACSVERKGSRKCCVQGQYVPDNTAHFPQLVGQTRANNQVLTYCICTFFPPMVGCVNGDTCKRTLKFMTLRRPVVFLWLINRPLILILKLIPGNYYLAVLMRATSALITKAWVRYLMGEKGSMRVRGPLTY